MLSPATPTWAHVLGIAGYETSLLGRMHFEGHDQYHGFEHRPIGEMFAIHPGGFGGEKYPSGQNRRVMELSGKGTTTYQWMDEQITNEACNYLKDHAQKQERPFAAVIGYVLPHCPFIAPEELFDYYHDIVDIPEVESDQPAMIKWYRKSRGIDIPLDERRVRIVRAAYFALCEQLDGFVGQILDCLEQAGLADNTLVVYCSDHGEMAGEHGCWTKNTYYEGSVGVPLIFRMPGLIPPGTSANQICNLMDIGPTLADIIGAPELPEWDGRSLLPSLSGKQTPDWPNETFSEVVDTMPGSCIPSRMIRSGQWKLWVDQEATGQELNVALFDLQNDPGELHDLSKDPAYSQIRRDLLAKVLNEWDPEYVRSESLRKAQDYSLIAKWGRNVGKSLPELLPPPHPSIEDDVQIL